MCAVVPIVCTTSAPLSGPKSVFFGADVKRKRFYLVRTRGRLVFISSAVLLTAAAVGSFFTWFLTTSPVFGSSRNRLVRSFGAAFLFLWDLGCGGGAGKLSYGRSFGLVALLFFCLVSFSPRLSRSPSSLFLLWVSGHAHLPTNCCSCPTCSPVGIFKSYQIRLIVLSTYNVTFGDVVAYMTNWPCSWRNDGTRNPKILVHQLR